MACDLDAYAPVEIRHIRDPLWTKPTFVRSGESFDVVAALPGVEVERATVELRSAFGARRASVVEHAPTVGGRFHRIRCQVHADTPAALYDLHLHWPGGCDVMPHAVKVVEAFPDDFTFVHIGDPHVSRSRAVEPGAQPGDKLRTVVEQINLLNPDLVLLTGDLVYRYGREKEVINGTEVDADMRTAQRLLLGLEVPLFLTAGNHDLAFPWIRESYRRHMIRPLEGATMDYDFAYGPVRFLSFEAFCHYDECPPGGVRQSMTDEQFAWLDQRLGAAQEAAARVMFFHYDYNKQLPPLFDRHRVNLALYGHTSPPHDKLVGTTPTRTVMERTVFRTGNFRLVNVRGGNVDDQCVFNDEIVEAGRPVVCAFEQPNDGSACRAVATLCNQSERDLIGVRVRFQMRGRGDPYRAVGGEIVRQGERDGEATRVCDVLADVPAGRSVRVEVS